MPYQKTLSGAVARTAAVTAKKRPPKTTSSGAPVTVAKKTKNKIQGFVGVAAKRNAVPVEAEDPKKRFTMQQISEEEKLTRKQRIKDLITSYRTAPYIPLRDTIDDFDNRLVVCRGPVNAQLMIIGEAPGKEEAASGSPFVGDSGRLLASYLKVYGILLDSEVFITNTVFVRPSTTNRDPCWEEVVAHTPYVRGLIDIVRPRVILCMGRISSALLRNGFGNLEPLKGNLREGTDMHMIKDINMNSIYQTSSNTSVISLERERFVVRTYASYHPAALLRASKGKNASLFEERWSDDFKFVRQLITDPAIDYIDVSEIVNSTTPPGFQFTNPNQTFYSNPQKLSTLARESYAKDGIEMELQKGEYKSKRNDFMLFGSTIDNHSVVLRVKRLKFSFKVSHPSIKRGALNSEEELSQLERDLQEAANIAFLKGRGRFNQSVHVWDAKINLTLETRRKEIDIGQPKTFLVVNYHDHNLTFALKEAITHLCGRFEDRRPPKFYESNLTPLDQLLLDKNIYIKGWIKVAAPPPDDFSNGSSLRLCTKFKLTSTELEYMVDYDDLVGFSPNIGEAPDKKWERCAPDRYLSIDAEMLGKPGFFPTPEQDPIINICAVGHVFDRHDNKNYLERLRISVKGKDRETRLTGRSNYSDGAVFSVGSLERCSYREFKRIYLPNVPLPPSEFARTLSEGGLVEESKATETTPATFSYHEKYAESIRLWNDFIQKFKLWKNLVGKKRCERVILNHHLLLALDSLEERPGGEDPKKEWTDKNKVLAWESNVKKVIERWKFVSKRDISAIHEPSKWMNIHHFDVNTTPEETIVQLTEDYGEIQARWNMMHKEPRVFAFDSEKNMLRGFYKYVREFDPHIITGYNINNFDLTYFVKRVKVLELREEPDTQTQRAIDSGFDGDNDEGGPKVGNFISLGRIYSEQDEVVVKQSFSAATGERTFHTLKIGGRNIYDFMNYVMREVKLSSFGLGAVSRHFLNDTKNDVPHTSIPQLFRNDRKTLSDYCFKDAELVMMLLIITNNPTFLTSLARLISLLNIERLYVDGKQIQVFSVLMRYIRTDDAIKLMNDFNKYSGTSEDFSGAYVGDPKFKGLYELLLLCLDYNSLYPSIMLAFFLSHSNMGNAARMAKLGVSLSDCHRTRRQFINPKTKLLEYYYFKQAKKYTEKEATALGIRKDQCNIFEPKEVYHHFNRSYLQHIPRKVRLELNPDFEPSGVDPIKQAFEELHQLHERDPSSRPGPPDPESLGKFEPDPETGQVFVEPQDVPVPPDYQVVYYVFAKEDKNYTRFSVKFEELEERKLSLEQAVGAVVKRPEYWALKLEDGAICGSTRKVLGARSRIKKMMPAFKTSSPEYKRLDSNQLSLKIIANSGYGATGVKSGKLAAIAISDTVTAEGRRTIKHLSKRCHERYAADNQGGDTDSVFTHFPHIKKLDQIYEKITFTDPETGLTVKKSRIGEILDFCNSLVPNPMKIDFEKAFSKMFPIKKKRAACRTNMPKWDSIKQCMVFKGHGYLDFKGLETKRRDSCEIAQKTFTGFLKRLMAPEGSVKERTDKAITYVRKRVLQTIAGNIERHQTIQSRQISKKEYSTKLPHIELCKKLKKRGQPVPGLGERVPFVVIKSSSNFGFADSVEDPKKMMEMNWEPDYEYIVRKKIMKPIQRFTERMEPHTKDLDRRMFGDIRKVQERIITEENPFFQYMTPKIKCKMCGLPNANLICSDCIGSVDWQYYFDETLRKIDEEKEKVRVGEIKCRDCTGALPGQPIHCSNNMCESYFPRNNAEIQAENFGRDLFKIKTQAADNGFLVDELDW